MIAGLVACYRGLTITGGGAKAVGNAVNETVVYAFMALFVINVVVTAIGIRATVSDGERHVDAESDLSAPVPLLRPSSAAGRRIAPIGDHTLFYGQAIAGIPHAVLRYRREVIRLIAEISMGAGTLAMIGGTVVIVGFLTLASGGMLAVQGYSSLGNIGIEALTGFLAAFINVRIAAPVVAGIGLAATFGAGVTAQLGAMRINEEIDALEAMAIRPIEYLGQHPDRRGHDRGHPAVLDRGDPVVRREQVHHRGALRAVLGPVQPLLLNVSEPDRPVVVVPASHPDGAGGPVGAHVLRLFRHRRTSGRRDRGRQRGARPR